MWLRWILLEELIWRGFEENIGLSSNNSMVSCNCKGTQRHAKARKGKGKCKGKCKGMQRQRHGKAKAWHVYGAVIPKKWNFTRWFFLAVKKVRSRPRSTRCTSVVGRWHLYILYKMLARWVGVMCAVIKMWSGGRGLPDTIVLIDMNDWL